jgi:primase-polymerase (primpol)-like protein
VARRCAAAAVAGDARLDSVALDRGAEGRLMLTTLPLDVRQSTRCVVWRCERRAGRPTKVPYMAVAPMVRAAVDDPRTWAAFDDAVWVVRAGHADGVGLVLGAGICGADFDHVRDVETGLVAADVVGLVAQLDSYTEVSPSGSGLHVLARGTLPPGRRRRGCVELYDGGRFFTLTGRHVAGTPRTLEDRTAALAALHAQLFAAAPQTSTSAHPAPIAVDAELLRRAHAAKNGAKFAALWRGDASRYSSRSEADLALCGLLAFWTGGAADRVDRLFRASGLMRPKWDAPRGTETYGARTIAVALGGRR